MKRLLTFCLFAFAIVLNGQNYNDITKKTTFNDNDGVFVHDVNASHTYGGALSNLRDYFLQTDYNITDEWIFAKAIGLAALSTTEVTNGLFLNSSTGKLSFYYNGAIYNVPTTDDLVEYSLGDTTHIVHDNASSTLSATYTLSGILDARTGDIYLPHETTARSDSTTGNYHFYFNDADQMLWLNINDGGDKYPVQYVTLDWIKAQSFYSVSGSYWTTNSNQTSLTGNKTATSGTWTPKLLSFGGVDAGRNLSLPRDKNDVVTASEGYVKLDDNDDSRFNVHDGTSWVPYMRETDTQDLIDENYSFNAPSTITDAEIDTLFFTDRNYITVNYTSLSESDFDLYISNSAYGAICFTVNGSTNLINIYAKNGFGATAWGTIKWAGDIEPDLSDLTATYEILLKRKDATTILASYTWYK